MAKTSEVRNVKLSQLMRSACQVVVRQGRAKQNRSESGGAYHGDRYFGEGCARSR